MEPDLNKGITLSTSTQINTLDDQVIITYSGIIYREEYSHYKSSKQFWNGNITKKKNVRRWHF